MGLTEINNRNESEQMSDNMKPTRRNIKWFINVPVGINVRMCEYYEKWGKPQAGNG